MPRRHLYSLLCEARKVGIQSGDSGGLAAFEVARNWANSATGMRVGKRRSAGFRKGGAVEGRVPRRVRQSSKATRRRKVDLPAPGWPMMAVLRPVTACSSGRRCWCWSIAPLSWLVASVVRGM